MCQALLEIMEPEINKIVETETKKSHVLGMITAFRAMGQSDDEIRESLIKKCGLKESAVALYL